MLTKWKSSENEEDVKDEHTVTMMIMQKAKFLELLESFSLNALGVIAAGGRPQPEGKFEVNQISINKWASPWAADVITLSAESFSGKQRQISSNLRVF